MEITRQADYAIRAILFLTENEKKGRTPTNKLVFVESEEDLRGRLLAVTVTWTGAWSMQGRLEG